MNDAARAVLKALIPATVRPRLKRAYRRLSYAGFRYECPFCHARLRRFAPFGLDFPVLAEKHVVGGGRRQNAQCPNCGSLDRERLLYLYLQRKTDAFRKPTSLLHVAPEQRLEPVLRSQPNIDYLTADLYAENVMVKMDITDIRYPDATFDAIICNHVLEHIVDDRRAMSELCRVLKPGGWAILQVPMSQSLDATYEDFTITSGDAREQAFGQDDHVRIYAKDYAGRLAGAGFAVEVFEWRSDAGQFGGRRNRFGLNEDEAMYVVRK